MTVKCNPPRAYAAPATEPEVVYIPERTLPRTRTVLVLGIRVEIPLQPQPRRTFIKV